jgi:HAD superfamily hydrolase (TIGR01509 family)
MSEKSIIKGVVFDMDGLMFDTEHLTMDGWDYAAKELGFSIPKDIQLQVIGLAEKYTKRVFEEYFGEDFNFYETKRLRINYVTSYIEKNGIPIKKGLIELLDYLKANGYMIAVATSTNKERANFYFDKAGISGYLDAVVCGDMIENSKPEPDIYLKAGELIGIPPQECLALEDSPIGILSAYRAGMKPVMIPDLVQADHDTNRLLYAKLETLLDVIVLLSSKENS